MTAEGLEPGADAADMAAVLELSALTYRAVTDVRRRLATGIVVLALAFGLVAVVSTVLWLQTRAEVDRVEDRPLVEALGVEIPDPRPAVERAGLRLRGLVFAVCAVAAMLIALPLGALWALLRPPPLPPRLAAHVRASRTRSTESTQSG